MREIDTLIRSLENGEYDAHLKDIYIDKNAIKTQVPRYIQALKNFSALFGTGPVCIFSAPGRSEIGGNHTDHQHGHVLAASIQLDAIAVVRPTTEKKIRFQSEGYELVEVPLEVMEPIIEEYGSVSSLVKGVLSGFKKQGYKIGGFEAYITSDVLIGAGLSSSAAFETIIGTILSGLYNDSAISPIEIAKIGQYAENVYFGKPCGLMDQMACSVGSLVHIDFKDPENPDVERIDFSLSDVKYCLCITDTKGSHANLTADYAAIPLEMGQVATLLGKDVLGDLSPEGIYSNLVKIREELGDRAALRAIHFFEENQRAISEAEALKTKDFKRFLQLVKESGDSSFKYLQNVYTNQDVRHQNISIALAYSDHLLNSSGVSRVHGGGFAGTIQAFVPLSQIAQYKEGMDSIFGKDACQALHIRKYGGILVI